MADITVTQLKQRLDAGERPVLIDVREEYERQAGNIGGLHIPMGSLPLMLDDLTQYKDQEVIVYCRSGGRSGSAVAFLTQQAGFKNARNLVGGVTAWKAQVDPAFTVA
jgi:adenylyltransferase/sulfurtransferase